MPRSKPSLYLVNVVPTMLVLPLVSILLSRAAREGTPLWPCIGKWFVFWAIGVRLCIAGILHVWKKPDSTNEAIALISDLFIFTILLLYLLFI